MPPTHQNTKFHQRNFNQIPEELGIIGELIVDAACTAHKNSGPRLLETVNPVWEAKV